MLLRSESPSPVDEDDPDSRIKRQRRTTLTLEHTPPKKRKLPSCPQSPAEEEDVITKRQRCTALEHGIERLSLTPPSRPAHDTAMAAPGEPELATRLPAPVPAPSVPDFGFSSSWLDIPATSSASLPALAVAPGFQQISAPTNVEPLPPFAMTTAPVLPASSAPAPAAIEDVKMRSSSWYEPEKDRACVRAPFFEPPTDAATWMYRDRRHRLGRVVGRRRRRRRRRGRRAEAAARSAAGAVARRRSADASGRASVRAFAPAGLSVVVAPITTST